jgi:hypothetical protein
MMMAQIGQFVLSQTVENRGYYMKNKVFTVFIILFLSSFIFAQRPPRGEGRPPFPPNGESPFPRGQKPMERGDKHQMRGHPDWVKSVDTNNNKRIEKEEFRIAANDFFNAVDKNQNGILEENELPLPPQINQDRGKKVPPFLFLNRNQINLNKEQFDEKSNLKFIEFDINGDGVIDFEEVKNVRPPDKPWMPNMALAQFIGAEMRFGDKVTKNAPFSAETIRIENKRLFDGSLIKSESKGSIYRDSEGRTRQEQPLESIAGYKVLDNNNEPAKRVFVVDVVSGESFSLFKDTKTASKIKQLPYSPVTPKNEPKDAQKESLGTKKIDNLNAEGTRITIEIPVGQIGNDKPIFVVTEKWFSPELQMIIYSKHSDPFIGEVVFQLVNIKLGEPSADLFKIPNDYKIIEFPNRKNEK